MFTKQTITRRKAKAVLKKARKFNPSLYQAMEIYKADVEEVNLRGIFRVAIIVTVGTHRILIPLQSDVNCGNLNLTLNRAFKILAI